MGTLKHIKLVDEENLMLASAALKNVEIKVSDYSNVSIIADAGYFVYLDPPYFPLSETSNFTSYTSRVFLKNEHLKLFDLYEKLSLKQVKIMQSNSCAEFINELYKDYKKIKIGANRSINSKKESRGKILENLILNY